MGVLQRIAIIYIMLVCVHIASRYGRYKSITILFAIFMVTLYFYLMIYLSWKKDCNPFELIPTCNY